VTQQRVAVLEYLCATPTHPTAEEIGTAVNRAQPTTSRASVYNVLHSLKERGLIEELVFDDAVARYDATSAAPPLPLHGLRRGARRPLRPRCRRCRRSASRPATRSRAWTSPSAAPARPARAGPDPHAGLIQPHRFRSPVRGPNGRGRSLAQRHGRSERGVCLADLRDGRSPRAAGSLVSGAADAGEPAPGLVNVDAFGELEWTGLRRGAAGRFPRLGGGIRRRGIERVQALQARQPGAPIVARVPEGRPDLVTGMLRAGVLEVFTEDALFREALERARARVPLTEAKHADASRWPAADEPSHDGLFPNLFDWIYVVGIAEDGVLSFQT